MSERRRGGPPDPQRRDRIARAAVDVVAEHGIEGLTHRRVAAAAGVPLGSTTYYFATLDDLMEAGIEQAMAASIDELDEWASGIGPGDDLTRRIADLLIRRGGRDRSRTVAYYEFYLAAIRRPHLRRHTTRWNRQYTKLLGRRVDADVADVLAATFDGLLLESLIRGRPLPRRRLEALIRAVLAAGR